MNIINLLFTETTITNSVLVKMKNDRKLITALTVVCKKYGCHANKTDIFYNDVQLDVNKTPSELNLPENALIKFRYNAAC